LAIFVGFLVATVVFMPLSRQVICLVIACLVMVVVGAIDDARDLRPLTKLAWQFVAAAVALAGGIGITVITNPLGGVIDLSWGRFAVDLFGFHFHIAPIANAVSLLWMVGVANTVNFLDGLDGLAAGVSGIAGVILFLLSMGVNQPLVALLAIILAGSAFGFLPMNFNPAKIFMGDSGAYFLGLVLAMLSIYSGGKLATAVLVLGLPIFDAIWAVVRRLAQGRSPFSADKGHIYHLLIGAGFSQREVALALYVFALVCGLAAIFINSPGKLMAIAAMFAALAILVSVLTIASVRRGNNGKGA
jgi:UDP-GlcNAc:undecaprenyl-phosphate GlcNAc-1-phosphate transferase